MDESRKYLICAFLSTIQTQLIAQNASLNSLLIDWLEELPSIAPESTSFRHLVSLFVQLQEAKLYVFATHLQWIIARGGLPLAQVRA